MNRRRRILIGALLGAILTLLVHPISSRFILTPFLRIGPSGPIANSAWLPKNLEVLPPPMDTLQASLWMQTAAEMLVQRRLITQKNLEKIVQVAEAAARGEPENAFWLHMNAVFLWELGRKEQALQRWHRASHAASWNDYQSRRLLYLRDELVQADGGAMAWHSAAAYYQRSDAVARTTVILARAFFERMRLTPAKELELRLTTLRNGRLLRDGSRSITVGKYGVQLVELACAPLAGIGSSPRQQILSRYSLVNNLRAGMGDQEASETDDAFRTNDAWMALAEPRRAQESVQGQAWASVLLACVPGILFGLALVGLAIQGLAALFVSRPALQALLRPPWTPAFGVVAGLGLYFQTGLVLAAAAVTLCFAFVAYEPANVRTKLPSRMGVGFRSAVLGLAILFVALLGGFWTGICAPTVELLRFLPLPGELFGGNTILLALSALVASMLFVAAPGWAIVDRVPTSYALVVTFRDFGRRVMWLGLVCGLVAIPAAVYLDNQVRSTVNVLLTNEPAHYLLQ